MKLNIYWQTTNYFFFLLVCLLSNSVNAQGNLNLFQRQRIYLNGEWEYKNKNDKNWLKIDLPNNIHERGVLFFKRSFLIPSQFRNAQFKITFEGINFSSKIRLNGQYLATQSHGFTPIVVSIPPGHLQFQEENKIEIEVNTELSNSTIPLKSALFQPSLLSGIFRDVYLDVFPPLCVVSIQNEINLSDDLKSANISSEIHLKGSQSFIQQFSTQNFYQSNINLNFRVLEAQSPFTIVVNEIKQINRNNLLEEKIEFPFSISHPKLWDHDQPNMYTIVMDIEVNGRLIDKYVKKIGIRKIALKDNQLLFNNNSMILKGITFIEDEKNNFLNDSTNILLESIKNLGFNSISWFFPPPESILTKSDSLGLISFLRIPIWNIPSKTLDVQSILEESEKLLDKILILAENHPSVIGIVLGHGFDASENDSYDYIRYLKNKIPAKNDLLITAAFRGFSKLSNQISLDFVSLDLIGDFSSNLTSWIDKWIIDNPNLPLLFTDVSVPYLPNSQDSENRSHFEYDQAYSLKQILKHISEHPNLGFILSSYYDWYGTYPTLFSHLSAHSKLFPFGIASENGTPRMALSMIQNLNSNENDQFAFQEESHTEHEDNLFLIFGLVITALFLHLFRKDHRLRGNLIRILTRPFGFHMELREGRKISLSTSIIVFFTVVFCWALIFSSTFYFLRHSPLFDFFLVNIIPIMKIKILLIKMSWYPPLGLLGFSILISLLFLVFVIYVLILSMMLNKTLSFRNTFTFVGWESSVFIFLLPIAILFHRLLSISPMLVLLIVLLLLFFIWYGYRLFVGMETIFAFPKWLSFIFIFLLPMFFISIILLIINQNNALFAQTEYIYNIWRSGL